MELVDESSGQNDDGNLFIAKNETRTNKIMPWRYRKTVNKNHQTLTQEKVNLPQINICHK